METRDLLYKERNSARMRILLPLRENLFVMETLCIPQLLAHTVKAQVFAIFL